MKQTISLRFYNLVMNYFGGKGLRKLPLVNNLKKFLISLAKSDVAEINGNTMYLGKDSLCLSINGIYEKLETKFIKENIKKGDVILDVGANIGYHTLLCAKLIGNSGKIFAFEPEPTNFKILQKNVKINNYKNVVLINSAVSDKIGTVNLYLSNDGMGMHRIYPSHFCSKKYLKTNLISLDAYFSDDPIREKISFIKIDVEGSELGVLKGMKSMLSNKQLTVLLEFVPSCLKEFGSKPDEVLELLKSYGFQFYFSNEQDQAIQPVDDLKLFLSKFDGDVHEKRPKGTNLICIKH